MDPDVDLANSVVNYTLTIYFAIEMARAPAPGRLLLCPRLSYTRLAPAAPGRHPPAALRYSSPVSPYAPRTHHP